MSIKDEKMALRSLLKQKRAEINIQDKQKADQIICDKLLSLNEIKNAKTVLTFVSTKDEVDTICFIKSLFSLHKNVAVPKCIDINGNMSFYLISSLESLLENSFGIFEPSDKSEKLQDFSNSVCIIPALSFDKNKQRIGYGKGYYDRFLKEYKGIKIGICYDELITQKLPCDSFDISADKVITQTQIF